MMRVAILGMALVLPCAYARAQAGGSFITSDHISRAPAVTLHCAGAGNIAVPCGSSSQPIFITTSTPLATAGNQASEIVSQQAIAVAAGAPQDSVYVGGSGSIIALLKGLYSALSAGIATVPFSGSLTSRSQVFASAQSFTLFPANAGRHFLAFQVPVNTAMWINFLGGAASPNGVDCVQLSAGTLYESGSLATRGAVSIYLPIAASVAAWEG